MAWSGFPATQTTDWSALTFVEQFVKAVSERRQSIGQSALSNPAVGWDVQSAAASPGASELSWRYLQNLLEGLITSFVNSHDSGGNIRATDYYDGRATIDMWAQAAWRTAASINASGFTRKYPDGMGGTTTAYGLMQAGDYIGSWIFNELKAGLDLLIWTKTSGSWTANGENNWRQGIGEDADWATAKSDAESTASDSSADIRPMADTMGWRSSSPPDPYHAQLRAAYGYMSMAVPWTGVNHQARFYTTAGRDGKDEYDLYGIASQVPVGYTEDYWFTWSQGSVNSNSTDISSALGDKTTWLPWIGSPVADGAFHYRGYRVRSGSSSIVLLAWNVTGGFVYV